MEIYIHPHFLSNFYPLRQNYLLQFPIQTFARYCIGNVLLHCSSKGMKKEKKFHKTVKSVSVSRARRPLRGHRDNTKTINHRPYPTNLELYIFVRARLPRV